MPTPRAAKHDDLEQRLRDMERQLRQLTGAALSRDKLGVFTGDFVVGDGANVRVEGTGDVVTVDGAGHVTGGLSGAVADAGTALSAANDAHDLATTAQTTATTAQGTATAAGTAAATAQGAADAAQSTADTAASTASSAASTASSAASDAATALSTANSAATAASDAQAAADAADAAAASAAGIAGAKADVLIQSTTPATSYQASTTLWIDTTGSTNTPKRWNGSAWVAVTDKAATDAANAAAAADAAADAAQSTADAAASAASAAQSAANAAQSTANSAATAASTAQTTANGKNKVTYSDTASPGTTANTAGDVWFRTLSGKIIEQWQGNGGTSWSLVQIANAVIANLDAGKITAGTLDVANRISAGSIDAAKIVGDSITAGQIAANAITTTELAANAVTAAKIAAGTITANELAANSITSAKIATGALDATTITSPVIRTASSGTRMVIQNDTSGGIMTFLHGIAGEFPGILNPQLGTVGQPQLALRASTNGTDNVPVGLTLSSGSTASGHQPFISLSPSAIGTVVIGTGFNCDTNGNIVTGSVHTTGNLQANGTLDVSNDATCHGILSGNRVFVTTVPTTGGAANVRMAAGTGELFTATSSLRYKQDVEAAEVDTDAVLSLAGRTWRDRKEVEADPDTGTRYIGFIAEELHDAGLSDYVDYDDQGRPNAIQYDRLTVPLLHVAKEQRQQIADLEDRLACLEAKLTG